MDSSSKNKTGHRGKQENSRNLENEIRELKDDVANLTSSISNLKEQMNYLENLVTNELVKLIDEQIENKNLNNNDVELDSSKGDEDSLTPSHLFTLSKSSGK
jgi:predicted  nucleic acid-binding Zn-ribbon protein